MEKIIPRWEWRTFGDDLSKGEENIKKQGNSRDRVSKEIYILSKNSNENTKNLMELVPMSNIAYLFIFCPLETNQDLVIKPKSLFHCFDVINIFIFS